MKNDEKISQIISGIDDKYIQEADSYNENSIHETRTDRSGEKTAWRRWLALTACLVLVIVSGALVFGFTAEAREYNEAMDFFEEHGLSAEGLSRAEVRAVYRDIKTESFTYGMTSEVMKQSVPGWEITQAEPTPEELAAVWFTGTWTHETSKDGIRYKVEYIYPDNVVYGGYTVEKSVLRCLSGDDLIWETEFERAEVYGQARMPEGTSVWGREMRNAPDLPGTSWIALVGEDGSVVWKYYLNHGYETEYVAAVFANDDGTWAVISRGDIKYLCLSIRDPNGKETYFKATEVGNFGIWNAARLGDGYIVQLGNGMTGDTARVCVMDREGNITDDHSYEEDGLMYRITDMAEFGGNVYLSAYAVPEQKDEGGRDEIANILDYIFRDGTDWAIITSETLTPVVRKNYTAVLLVCSPEDGIPKVFYSVNGSLGRKLHAEDPEKLEWDVESITSTFFSPATSSFTIGGTCRVFRYSFDSNGTLIGQTDTGETTDYRR